MDLHHLNGRFCLYVLRVEPEFYKYGISEQVHDRLCTHVRDMNFAEIVEIFDCTNKWIMIKLERVIGMAAETLHERVRKYDKTEIIHTQNIEYYLRLARETIALALSSSVNEIYDGPTTDRAIMELRRDVDALKNNVMKRDRKRVGVGVIAPKVNVVKTKPLTINQPLDWILANTRYETESMHEYYLRYGACTSDYISEARFHALVMNLA